MGFFRITDVDQMSKCLLTYSKTNCYHLSRLHLCCRTELSAEVFMKQLLRQGVYVVLAQATAWQYYTAFKILIVLTTQGVFLWSGLLGFKNPLLDFHFCFVCKISTCFHIHVLVAFFFFWLLLHTLLVRLRGSSFRKAAGVKQRLQSTMKFCSLSSLCFNFAISLT